MLGCSMHKSPGLATCVICLKSGTEPPNYVFGDFFFNPFTSDVNAQVGAFIIVFCW